MDRLNFARSFHDLVVYRKARAVAQRIFVLTRGFPTEERYSLIDQMRRSSRSVGAQIAEAWAKSRYPKHFASKLSDADGEQSETQHWIETAEDCAYLDAGTVKEILDELRQVGRMLGTMIERAEAFRGDANRDVREEPGQYHLDLDEFFAASSGPADPPPALCPLL